MMKSKQFHIRYEPRRLSDVVSTKPHPVLDVEFPLGTVLHYPVYSQTQIGLAPTHPLLKEKDLNIYAEFVESMDIVKGTPKELRYNANTDIRNYMRKSRSIRPLKDLERSLGLKGSVVLYNYGILPKKYRYASSTYSLFHSQYNLNHAPIAKIKELDGLEFDVEQFLILEVPDVFPSLEMLKKYEQGIITKDTVSSFTDPSSLYIYELWMWLGESSRQSMFRGLSSTDLSKLHIHASNGKEWVSTTLDLFWDSRESTKDDIEDELPERKGSKPKSIQKRMMRLLSSLNGGADDIFSEDEAETDEPAKTTDALDEASQSDTTGNLDFDEDDENILVGDVDAIDSGVDDTEIVSVVESNDPAEAAKNRIKEAALERGLSEEATARLIKNADAYKSLPNPFGEGTVADHLKVDPDAPKVKPKKYRKTTRVFDERLLESSLDDFDERYAKDLFTKDILASAVAVQKSGVLVKDIKVEDHEDIMNGYYKISVQMEVPGGAVSTSKFQIPKVSEEGTIFVNGTKYRLRKQRVDRPIRKIDAHRVSLTSSGYGKVNVNRADKVASNYATWISRQIRSIAFDNEDPRIESYRGGDVTNKDVVLPRPYTAVAKNVRSMVLQDKTELVFDYELVKDLKPTDKGRIPLTVDGSVEMDELGMIWKGKTELGQLHSLLGLGTPPKEFAYVKLFDKEIPVGFVLSYRSGLTNLLKTTKAVHRFVLPGTRIDLSDSEIAIRFSDKTLVVDVSNLEHQLIFAGIAQYAKHIRKYTTADFEKTAAYQVVLEENGVGSKYLKEIDHFYNMFVDPVTERLLNNIKEPTDVDGLLRRSVELLTNDAHPEETDMQAQRVRGYEKFTTELYSEMSKAVRQMNNRPKTRFSKIEVDPFAMWKRLLDDPAMILVQEQNPLHSIKEREMLTFNGLGGRSTRSMVERHRRFLRSDCGIISEAGKDDSGVGVNTQLATNANIGSVYGETNSISDEDYTDATKFYSATGLLSPFTDHDDQLRSAH